MPSELLQLQWNHIDWENGRLTIHSPKTETTKPVRVIPLFPEFRPALEVLFADAPAGSQYVFDRYRSTAAKVYRAAMLRILTAAGIEPWPKLWMNLRASCRTDQLERFPDHVVNYWLGHTGTVGAKHCDRVHDGHYTEACGVACGVADSPLTAPSRPPEESKH
ncbi:Phage integrase family protein [Aureliella helgolandensis]|uniref:Phage integrase family protein n=2 Tax=Aureliella helgolandensis TaxID=2527968 RepID=A0A518GDH2_9BACT|nr:Phage integrase family protein [Aureliella helgolandensis]